MTTSRSKFGQEGEDIAETFLMSHGMKRLGRRFNTPVGELDLVMQEGKTVVFVEVKTRSNDDWADPQDAVNATKRRRLLRAANWFLHAHRLEASACRFDIVTVIVAPTEPPRVQHFPDAFVPER